jgi:peptide/nickel transport system permease protein
VTAFVLRRIGVSLVIFALASIAIFVVLRVIPGDPTAARASSPGVTAAQLREARHELGLDRSIASQYVSWVGGVVHGDFGESFFSDFSTTELIRTRIGASVELAVAALAVALLVAVPAAVAIGLRPGSIVDRGLSALAAAGLAVPVFCLGLLLIAVFSIELGWLPTRGYVSLADDPLENLRDLALPALTMGLFVAAPILRFLRSALLEQLGADYVRTATGTGLPWRRVVIRHALPNSLLPTLAFVGAVVGQMLGGVVVIEYVFGWPGLGSLAVDSVGKRDYAVLQGVVLLAAAAFIATSLLVDVLSVLIDPRLRREASG